MRSFLVAVIMLSGCSNRTSTMSTADLSTPAGLMLEPTPAKIGTLVLWGYQFTGPTYHTSMLAKFGDGDGKSGPCSVETIDSCRVEICPVPDGGGALAPSFTYVDAGNIVYNGPGATTFMLTTTNGDDIYVGDIEFSWVGGENLMLQGSGSADVPAFTISTTAPTRANVLTPVIPTAGAPIVVKRSAGFPITWTPVDGANADLQLVGTGVTVDCTARSDAGIITVPPSVLNALPVPAVDGTLFINNTATAMAGTWPVSLVAQSPALDSMGMTGWSVAISLQ